MTITPATSVPPVPPVSTGVFSQVGTKVKNAGTALCKSVMDVIYKIFGFLKDSVVSVVDWCKRTFIPVSTAPTTVPNPGTGTPPTTGGTVPSATGTETPPSLTPRTDAENPPGDPKTKTEPTKTTVENPPKTGAADDANPTDGTKTDTENKKPTPKDSTSTAVKLTKAAFVLLVPAAILYGLKYTGLESTLEGFGTDIGLPKILHGLDILKEDVNLNLLDFSIMQSLKYGTGFAVVAKITQMYTNYTASFCESINVINARADIDKKINAENEEIKKHTKIHDDEGDDIRKRVKAGILLDSTAESEKSDKKFNSNVATSKKEIVKLNAEKLKKAVSSRVSFIDAVKGELTTWNATSMISSMANFIIPINPVYNVFGTLKFSCHVISNGFSAAGNKAGSAVKYVKSPFTRASEVLVEAKKTVVNSTCAVASTAWSGICNAAYVTSVPFTSFYNSGRVTKACVLTTAGIAGASYVFGLKNVLSVAGSGLGMTISTAKYVINGLRSSAN